MRVPDINFNPGPSQLLPHVAEYMAEGLEVAQLPHRSEVFKGVMADTTTAVKELLGVPEDYAVIYLDSATRSMQLTTAGLVEEKSWHLVNGAFSARWQQEAEQGARKHAHAEKVEWGKAVDLGALQPSIVDSGAELICVTHNETSTGVALDVDAIATLKIANPNALVAVDITSSAPFVKLDMSKVDAAFLSVQKGFGMLPGLGVLFLSPEAKVKAGYISGLPNAANGYQALPKLIDLAEKNQTAETPRTDMIFTLGKVATQLLETGIDNIRTATLTKERLLYSGLAELGMNAFVEDVRAQSATTVVVEAPVDAEEIVQGLLAAENILVGTGYGRFGNEHIRIANFPAHRDDQVVALLDALDALLVGRGLN